MPDAGRRTPDAGRRKPETGNGKPETGFPLAADGVRDWRVKRWQLSLDFLPLRFQPRREHQVLAK
jgi:hypothetical protein